METVYSSETLLHFTILYGVVPQDRNFHFCATVSSELVKQTYILFKCGMRSQEHAINLH
jgi:hypothetical protein